MKLTAILLLGTVLVLGQLDLTSAAACTAPGQVSGLTLREDDITNDLYVIWTAPTGTSGCDLSYRVTYSNDAPTPASQTFTTVEEFLVIERALLVPCSTTTITVTPVGSTDGTTSTASTVLATRPSTEPILRNMTTSCDSIQMTWEGQSFQENMCEVTHFQLFCLSDTHNFTVAQQVTDARDRTFEILISTALRPDVYYTCNGYMFITLAGFSPESESISFWSNLDKVRDLEVAYNNEVLRATWYPPLNSDQCGVAYYVTYENSEQGISTIQTEGLSHDFPFQVIPCTEYTVSVIPISFTGSNGTVASEVYEPVLTLDKVTNLVVADNADSLTVSWAQVTVGRCDIFFRVDHYVDGELYESEETTDSSINFARIPCSQNIFTVTVVSSGSNGEAVSVELGLSSGDVEDISEVRNIQVSGNTVTWEAPATVGRCQMSYIVEHTSPFGTVTLTTATTQASLTLVPCSSNTVTVKGFAGSLEGPSVEHTFTAASADLEAPENLQTIPDFTSARITMGAELSNINSCPITQAHVTCSNDDIAWFGVSFDVVDNAERVFSLDVDGLQRDTIYTCLVRWNNSPMSEEIRFRTIAIPNKQLSVEDVTKNGFNVRWTEEYGSEFVLNYQLVIESNGPAHSVRDDCEVSTGTYTFDFENGVFNSVFDDGLPNYGYTVKLITTYNLGSLGVTDVSSALTVTTSTSDPAAPEDMGIEFEYEGGTTYNVTGVISWIPPCELNGALSSFAVTVTASFQLGGVDQSVEYSTSVPASSPNNRYVYELRDINPFFRYVVTVNTVAASKGPGRDIVITPPDVCSCT